MNNEELLKILACPKCHGDLELVDNGFLCPQCQIVYPIEDDIPIMLIDKALPFDEWQKEHPCASS